MVWLFNETDLEKNTSTTPNCQLKENKPDVTDIVCLQQKLTFESPILQIFLLGIIILQQSLLKVSSRTFKMNMTIRYWSNNRKDSMTTFPNKCKGHCGESADLTKYIFISKKRHSELMKHFR